jgi:hypothetical protein
MRIERRGVAWSVSKGEADVPRSIHAEWRGSQARGGGVTRCDRV